MKFQAPMLVISDMDRAKAFYKDVLGMHVTMDLGANITLTGGLSLQTKESWQEFIHCAGDAIVFKGNNAEMYFEEDDFDAFLEKLSAREDIIYVHPVQEHDWGQRVVRFYDPDGHIIEVGENMRFVCRRFLDGGMTEEETAARMGVPVRMVKGYKR